MWSQNIGFTVEAFWQTVIMVCFASFFAVLLGAPLGILLWITDKNNVCPNRSLHKLLSLLINIGRSVPFIILMLAIIPLTRILVGTSIGVKAAIVPLTLSAIPFFARITEAAFAEIPLGLIEASQAMGASVGQMIGYVLLPESFSTLVRGVTLTIITLIGYSAMAGAMGGGGLGDLAIRYGYQRFDFKIMLTTLFLLILLVQGTQWMGHWIANKLYKGR